jgi:hypothetical protein
MCNAGNKRVSKVEESEGVLTRFFHSASLATALAKKSGKASTTADAVSAIAAATSGELSHDVAVGAAETGWLARKWATQATTRPQISFCGR